MVSNRCFVRILVVALLFSMVFLSATSAYANTENDVHEEMPPMESAEHAEMEDMMDGDHMEEDEHGEEEMHMEEGGHAHVHAEVPEEYASFTNPFEGNESVLEVGMEIYETACSFCHGKRGNGEGIAAKSLKVKPADFTDREMVMDMADNFWYWRVSEGIDGAGMPAWKNVLNETQHWQVINYAMNFSKGPDTRKVEEPPFYLLTEEEARKKGAHVIGLVANLSVILIAAMIFLIFKR